jgi:hypothetical protein
MSMDRGRFGSRDSATVRSVSGTHAAPIAASIQNSPCQPVEPTSAPPTRGPTAAPTADAAPHTETARSCVGPVVATDNRLSPQASTVEPAAPWIARPVMTPAPVFTRAISTQEATNSSKAPTKTRRRPTMSPSTPPVTITAAPTSE